MRLPQAKFGMAASLVRIHVAALHFRECRKRGRSDLFVPGGSGGIVSGRRSLAHGQFYFSISEAQFRRIERGAALASSTLVAIRNLCPSPLTSYEKTSCEETG